MKSVTVFISALALSALAFGPANARDYLTNERVYANDTISGNYGGATAYRGNYGSYTNQRNRYQSRYQAQQQAAREEARKPKYKAPVYAKKAVNFHKSATQIQRERQRTAPKRSTDSYSNAALNVRLINMRNKKKPVQRPRENQVVLPTVVQQPVRIAEATPTRVVPNATTPAGTSPQPATQYHYNSIGSGGGS